VRIHPGCDFHLSAGNIHDALAHPEKYTINHGSYLLVEFPELSRFQAAGEIFRRLLDAGLIPIISHPERNEHLRKHVEDLAGFVEAGCYVQVTAASITGLFGPEAKRSTSKLFERGLVHVVASDAHETKRRTPNLRGAYDALASTLEESVLEAVFSVNPAAIVANDMIDVPAPPLRSTRRWYQIWK
jgi:protein-tyrosine phosphatase